MRYVFIGNGDTMLSGTIQPAPTGGSHGLDTDTVLTAETAAAFASQGYQFALRYISLSSPQHPGDLTTEEAEAILGAGLALGVVQHVRRDGWAPTAEMGTQDGQCAAANAEQIGLPTGMLIWQDLEGVVSGTADSPTASDVIGYCNAWYDAVEAAGYVPGLYVGPQSILTANQLFYDLKTSHYWKSASRVPEVPVRGFQMFQSIVPDPVNGVSIDADITRADDEGDQATFLYPEPTQSADSEQDTLPGEEVEKLKESESGS